MKGAGVDITVTTTLPPARVMAGRIDGALRRVLQDYGRLFTRTFQDNWVGWVYKGRPANAPRLVSYDAWAFTVDSSGQNEIAIEITNEARDYRKGRSYVAAVHRTGQRTPEYIRVAQTEVAPLVPAFVAAMNDALMTEVLAPGPMRPVGTKGGAETVTIEAVL